MSLAAADIQRGTAANRLVLRDGSVATVRPATPDDRDAVRRFYHDLSPESRRRRFMTAGEAPQAIIDRLCDSSDPTQAMTLVAFRHLPDGVHVIAVCSYIADERHDGGSGLCGGRPLSGQGHRDVHARTSGRRSPPITASTGFRRARSTKTPRCSTCSATPGSKCGRNLKTVVIDVRLSVTPSSDGTRAIDERDRLATVASLRSMLEPKSIAVIGASRTPHASRPADLRRAQERWLPGRRLRGELQLRRDRRPALLPLAAGPAGRRGSRGRGGTDRSGPVGGR